MPPMTATIGAETTQWGGISSSQPPMIAKMSSTASAPGARIACRKSSMAPPMSVVTSAPRNGCGALTRFVPPRTANTVPMSLAASNAPGAVDAWRVRSPGRIIRRTPNAISTAGQNNRQMLTWRRSNELSSRMPPIAIQMMPFTGTRRPATCSRGLRNCCSPMAIRISGQKRSTEPASTRPRRSSIRYATEQRDTQSEQKARRRENSRMSGEDDVMVVVRGLYPVRSLTI